MPIGKNSLSRVKNNGYSNVKTSAPDMDDSKIKEEKAAPVTKKVPQKKLSAPKKTASAAKVTPTQKTQSSKNAEISTAKSNKRKNSYKVGEKLPPHLL
jgi:hypothetical protein